MPEYLSPGVYVEETSFRSKSIEGVSTSTAGFVGLARYGPITGDPELLTSFADFERIYGGLEDLVFADRRQTNYLALAVRAFFEEGGQRLYVSRVFNFPGGGYIPVENGGITVPKTGYGSYALLPPPAIPAPQPTTISLGQERPADHSFGEPEAGAEHPFGEPEAGAEHPFLEHEPQSPAAAPAPSQAIVTKSLPSMQLISRFPGTAGNMRLTFTLQAGDASVLNRKPDGSAPTLTRVQNYDLVHIRQGTQGTPPTWKPVGNSSDGLYSIRWDATQNDWLLTTLTTDDKVAETALKAFSLANRDPLLQIRPVTVTVEVACPNDRGFEAAVTLGNFSFDPRSPNGLTSTFTRAPATQSQFLTIPFSLELANDLSQQQNLVALRIARNLMSQDAIKSLLDDKADPAQVVYLQGGTDGDLPTDLVYEGNPKEEIEHDFVNDVPVQRWKNGLLALEGIEDISIVAAPGYSALPEDQAFAVHNALINHCEKMRYRIAVLDTPPKYSSRQALEFRNRRSSKYAALYYPWVTITDPGGKGRLNLPPSGFIAGIYARNDITHSVSKAPANEVVGSAIDFEQRLNKAQQDVLNPAGVNCLRFFPGHGFLVWGARTISDDPEWKYVNLRRYFAYLEHSLDRGTQWVVFQNNNQQLWGNVRRTIEDFLFNEWRMGSLMGTKPEEAYFVRCDLSTMTQNDLDNGRLVCQVGVAAVRPAEFVIFRIGQWTANSGNR